MHWACTDVTAPLVSSSSDTMRSVPHMKNYCSFVFLLVFFFGKLGFTKAFVYHVVRIEQQFL